MARCLTHSLDKIDLSHPKCNPFSYITETAYNVFRQRIKHEKRYAMAKVKLRDMVYDQFEQAEGIKKTKDNNIFDDGSDDQQDD